MTAHQQIQTPPASFFMPVDRPSGCVTVAGYGLIPRREKIGSAVADVYLQTGKKLRWVRDDER